MENNENITEVKLDNKQNICWKRKNSIARVWLREALDLYLLMVKVLISTLQDQFFNDC